MVLDVAFVSACAAAVAAVASPAATWLVTRFTQRHEVDMRIRQDKRDACLEILRTSQRQQRLLIATINALKNLARGGNLGLFHRWSQRN